MIINKNLSKNQNDKQTLSHPVYINEQSSIYVFFIIVVNTLNTLRQRFGPFLLLILIILYDINKDLF